MNSKQLAEEITSRFLHAMDNSLIDPERVRMFVVGPNRTFDALCLWASERWDNYMEPYDDNALTGISLHNWLDEVDTLERECHGKSARGKWISPLRTRFRNNPLFEEKLHEKIRKLETSIEEAFSIIAVDERFCKLPRLAGLFTCRLSSGGYANLIAFCHPKGDHFLWPVRDKRPKYRSCYHWAALCDEGILSFFPKGEKDIHDESEMDPHATLFRFDDMLLTRIVDRSDGIAFRLKGELTDREYQDGHTKEEWGGPSGKAVEQALIQHLQKRPELLFDPQAFPKIEDQQAVDRWLTLYESCNIQTGAKIIKHICDHQGLEAARIFLARQKEDREDRNATLVAFVEELSKAKRHEECLAICLTLDGKNRGRAGRHELTALLCLERYEELLHHYDEIIKEDESHTTYLAPWKALALSQLGAFEDAKALVEPLTDRNAKKRWRDDCFFALAHVLYNEDQDAAVEALLSGLRIGTPYLAAHDTKHFKDRPALLELMDKRNQIKSQRASFGQAIKERLTQVTAENIDITSEKTQQHTTCWELEKNVSFEKYAGDLVKTIQDDEKIYIKARNTGILISDMKAFSTTEPQATLHPPEQSYYTDLELQFPYLFVTNNSTGLEVLDVTQSTAPQRLWAYQSLMDESHNKIAMGPGILAVGDRKIDIFDVTNPKAPVLLSTLGNGYPAMESSSYQDFCFKDSLLVLSSLQHGLLIVDLSEPSSPKLLSATKLTSDTCYEKLHIMDDFVLLGTTDQSTWLIDISNPIAPKSVGLIDIRFQVPPKQTGKHLSGLDGDKAVWTLDFSTPTHPTLLKVEARKKGESEEFEDLYLERAQDVVWLDENRLIVPSGENLQLFHRKAMSITAESYRQLFCQLHAPFLEVIEEKLEHFAQEHPEYRMGLLFLDNWGGGTFVCSIQEPYSSTGVHHMSSESKHRWQFSNEALSIELSDSEEDYSEKREKAKAQAWHAVYQDLFRALCTKESFLSLASGQVYLGTSSNRGFEILDTFYNPNRVWSPIRSEIADKAPPTIEERLTGPQSYEYRDTFEQKAREDEEVRQTIFDLAHKHVREAQVVLHRLVDEWETEVLEAFLTISKERSLSSYFVSFLGNYHEQPKIQQELQRLFREGSDPVRVNAAVALGQCDEDSMVQLAKELLKTDNYQSADLAIELLKGMDKCLPELKEDLLVWVENMTRWDNRLPQIAIALFRAGHRELPPQVIKLAKREKRDEQYHGKNSFLADTLGGFTQHEACQAERLWTGWMLAQNVRSLKNTGDTKASVWPSELEHEPHINSWGYVLRAALPHLEEDGTLPFFEKLLKRHATPKEQYLPERTFLQLMFRSAVEKQDAITALELGETILGAPKGTFEQKILDNTKHRMFYTRLMIGWELLKARKLDDAAQYSKAALEEMPNDAQVLFFDARLTWLTHSIPDAMQKVQEYLKRISSRDRVGHARLLNLYGCALDELNRQEEAIGWFERAVQVQPDEPFYIANIAECHDKLRQNEQAIHWAKMAIEKGSTSEVVKNIVNGVPNEYKSNS